ncbi:MAG TPA: hypothetical protein VGI81_16895 [Tepidisphaeraceae bacterium]
MQYVTRSLTRGGWLLALGLAAAGCSTSSQSSTTHMQDLNNAVLSSYSGTHPDRLYYIGTQGDYDYYYMQNENKRYKVARNESLRDPTMPLTDDHAKWQIVTPGGPMERESGD